MHCLYTFGKRLADRPDVPRYLADEWRAMNGPPNSRPPPRSGFVFLSRCLLDRKGFLKGYAEHRVVITVRTDDRIAFDAVEHFCIQEF
ncbi:unnamed protein product [Nezara viridula]|uniref:Uncharacterized protein n=1 Tax=Nezara viridula TaxID=85310 RepID=A0A9P0E5S4_NEZVI|nr:unnamed protein product [Nezara viridula]